MGQRETVTQSSLDSNQSNLKDPQFVLSETDLNTKIYLLFYYILAWILPDQKLKIWKPFGWRDGMFAALLQMSSVNQNILNEQ